MLEFNLLQLITEDILDHRVTPLFVSCCRGDWLALNVYLFVSQLGDKNFQQWLAQYKESVGEVSHGTLWASS